MIPYGVITTIEQIKNFLKFVKSKKKCQLIGTIQIIITSTTFDNHISQNNMFMLANKKFED